MPAYLLLSGLRMRQAAGTSLLVIAVMAIPTLASRWALGHIDWVVSVEFAAGLFPCVIVGSNLAQRVAEPTLRHGFGWFLIAFGVAFTSYRLATA